MRVIKGLFICIFWILIVTLMIVPLGMVYEISLAEMEQYQPPEPPVLREMSIGGVGEAIRTDVAEYITIHGNFTSNTYIYQELDYRYPEKIRWYVSCGDEIQKGQSMGFYQGSEVTAEATGIVDEINSYGDNAYVRIQLFTPVEFESRVDERVLSILNRSAGLTTEDGETVTLIFASNRKNADGTTNIRMTIESEKYTYGQSVDAFRLMTGRVYYGALALPANCVYQKEPGDNNPWYVRQVTALGQYMAEIEVEIGYSNGDMVCVSGISEGTFYDSGYKVVIGG